MQEPTSKTSEEKGTTHWTWILAIIVLAGSTLFIIEKRSKKAVRKQIRR